MERILYWSNSNNHKKPQNYFVMMILYLIYLTTNISPILSSHMERILYIVIQLQKSQKPQNYFVMMILYLIYFTTNISPTLSSHLNPMTQWLNLKSQKQLAPLFQSNLRIKINSQFSLYYIWKDPVVDPFSNLNSKKL